MSLKKPVQVAVQFTWTPKRKKALQLALKGLPQAEIARRVRVRRHTLALRAPRAR